MLPYKRFIIFTSNKKQCKRFSFNLADGEHCNSEAQNEDLCGHQ